VVRSGDLLHLGYFGYRHVLCCYYPDTGLEGDIPSYQVYEEVSVYLGKPTEDKPIWTRVFQEQLHEKWYQVVLVGL
jgi:hypothetical protein